MKYVLRIKGTAYYAKALYNGSSPQSTLRLVDDVLDASFYYKASSVRDFRGYVMPCTAGEVVRVEAGLITLVPEPVPEPEKKPWYKRLTSIKP